MQDRDGGVLLLSTLFGQFPFLCKLFADSAYSGPIFHDAIGSVMPVLSIAIVKRSDNAKGFVVEPQRWIVERTIGWLNRCRRSRPRMIENALPRSMRAKAVPTKLPV